MKIIPDMYVSDNSWVRRSFRERFFSRPWRPWETTKVIKEPRIYFVQGPTGVAVICSYETAEKIRRGDIPMPEIPKEML